MTDPISTIPPCIIYEFGIRKQVLQNKFVKRLDFKSWLDFESWYMLTMNFY